MPKGGLQVRLSKNLGEYLRFKRFMDKEYTRIMAKRIGIGKSTFNEIETMKRKYIGEQTLEKILHWIITGD